MIHSILPRNVSHHLISLKEYKEHVLKIHASVNSFRYQYMLLRILTPILFRWYPSIFFNDAVQFLWIPLFECVHPIFLQFISVLYSKIINGLFRIRKWRCLDKRDLQCQQKANTGSFYAQIYFSIKYKSNWEKDI